MYRSALGIMLLFFVLTGVIRAAHAETANAPTSAKKPSVKKLAANKARAARKTSSARKKARRLSRTASSRRYPNSTVGDAIGLNRTSGPLHLKSNAALVVDPSTSEVLFEKNADIPLPIASLTKLMTALVVLESRQDMDEILKVTADDIDRLKNTSSRLRVGSRMSRDDMLHIALMSSENRAASALGRHYPGGLRGFVAAMNAKAEELGMHDTRFVEPTGLSSDNVSSAQDLAKLVTAAYEYPLIREYSTYPRYTVDAGSYRLQYVNSNRLVVNPRWEIGLQKTGYISEAGRCLVMQARIEGRPVVMVFLDSKGKYSRLGDAGRIRKWLEITEPDTFLHATAREG